MIELTAGQMEAVTAVLLEAAEAERLLNGRPRNDDLAAGPLCSKIMRLLDEIEDLHDSLDDARDRILELELNERD